MYASESYGTLLAYGMITQVNVPHLT